ncbi:hypothetical protein RI129_001417 [Pyrocoelia pectoralis]|uniref:RING finger protein 17 n=1 Tax=Pyrocoelia pectoralis TaxID=417401 RepID=A0AAN7VVH1_9COLE
MSVYSYSSSNVSSKTMYKSAHGSKFDSQKYVCPKCNMQYKYIAKHNVYHGKMPLILHCNHTLCEECIQDSFDKDGVTCFECGHYSSINTHNKQILQDIFPVNFYLMGVVSYLRPHLKNYDPKLKPTGLTYTSLANSQFGSTSTLCDQPESLESILQDKCCKDLCKHTATLRCLECNEVFCEYCCEPFHNSTRGFRKHRIVPSSLDIAPEVLDRCDVHTENPLELFCKTCEKYCCCYCIIQEHNGHDYYQISRADFMDAEEYQALIQNAGERLKRLILAHKNVREHLKRVSATSRNSVDAAITTYFLKLHAKLQCLENKIRSDAEAIKSKNVDVLNEIDDEVRSHIRTLNGLIDTALNVNNVNNKMKINVKFLIDKLKNYATLPCYLVEEDQLINGTQFNCEDPFEKLEESIGLQFKETEHNFRLLSEEELPENYNMNLPNDLASLDILNLNRSLTMSPESVSSVSTIAPSQSSSSVSNSRSRMPKTKSVEGWIKGINQSTFKKAPSFKPQDRHPVCISYIVTPERFYVQFVSQLQSLQRLNKEIKNYVQRFPPHVKRIPEIGALYIVNYHGPDWYRGRVIGIEQVDNRNVYTVVFVDYGNTKTVTDIADFTEINDVFAELVPFAHMCKLYDIYPAASKWSERETLFMGEIIAETEVIMVIIEHTNEMLEVDLLSCCGAETTSIRDALLFAGYGVSESSSSDIISSTTAESIKSNAKLHASGQNIKVGDELTVHISSIINVHNIYVQVINHLHHVKHLNTAMCDHYNNKENNQKSISKIRGENIYAPKKDMIVAVYLNDMFYRATVLQVLRGKGSVIVLLVDYGKTTTVHYTQLRKLPEKFRTLDCQAILVKLSHLKRIDDQEMDAKVQDYLTQYITKQTKLRLVIVNKEEVPSVVLFEVFGSMETCLNKSLVEEELALPLGDVSELLRYSEFSNKPDTKHSYVIDLLNTIQSSRETEQQEGNDSEDDKEVIKKRVHVLSCKSPDEIFVELDDSLLTELHQELHSSLQKYYNKKLKKEKVDWQINDFCVAYNSKCDQFFRGIIIDKIDDKLKVMLRDIVQEILVPSDALYVLHDQFKKQRERAIRCHLAFVIPAGDKNKWSGLAIDFLRNIFEQHHDISMTKNGAVDHDRKSVPVSMWYTETKLGGALERSKKILHNINKLLIKNGLALKVAGCLNNSTEITNKAVPEETIENRDIQIPCGDEARQTSSTPGVMINNALTESSQENPIDYHALFFTPVTIEKDGPPSKDNISQINNEPLDVTDVIDWNNIVEQDLLREKQLPHAVVGDGNHQQPKLIDLQEENLLMHQQIDCNNMKESALLPQPQLALDSGHEEISLMQEQPNMVINIKNNSWLNPVPFTEKNFRAVVSNIGNTGIIYAHLSSKRNALNYMIEKMNKYFKDVPPEPLGTVWMPGQLCTVKYHLNEEWYRGKIISVNGDVIKVTMIDFGNEEEVQHNDLRFAVMYLNLPPFANKIQLYQVYPVAGSKWLTSDLDELHKILVENEVEVSVIKKSSKPDLPICALVKLHNVNINEYMRNYSTNLVISPSADSLSENEDSDVIIEDEQFDLPCSISHSHSFKQGSLPQSLIGQKIEVTITTIMDYNQVLLEILVNCDVDEVRNLFESISEDIRHKGDKQEPLNTLEIGAACIAKFSEDGEWYRGEIVHLDNLDDGEVYIWFVDFGNSENVAINSIKTVDPDWLKLPVLQYKAIIDGIKLNDASSLCVVLEYMLDHCSTRKIAEIISVDPLHVNLYNGDELLYQDLIDQGLFIKTN